MLACSRNHDLGVQGGILHGRGGKLGLFPDVSVVVDIVCCCTKPLCVFTLVFSRPIKFFCGFFFFFPSLTPLIFAMRKSAAGRKQCTLVDDLDAHPEWNVRVVHICLFHNSAFCLVAERRVMPCRVEMAGLESSPHQTLPSPLLASPLGAAYLSGHQTIQRGSRMLLLLLRRRGQKVD